MNNLKKISLVGVVGSVFIGEYLWTNQHSTAHAIQGEADAKDATTHASIVPTVASLLLLDGPDFNSVPDAQDLVEDTFLDFTAVNNNLVTVNGGNIVSSTLSVNNGVLTITANAGLITSGGVGTSSFTISGTAQQINDALVTLSYQPDLDFNGVDRLSITTLDANGGSDTDTIELVVSPADDGAPDAVDDNYSTELNTLLTDNVTENDLVIDEALVDEVDDVATDQGGSISISANGEFTYLPPNNFVGNDSFTYTLSDVDGDSDTAIININAGIENDIPSIVIEDSDGATTPADNSVVEATASLINGSFTVTAGDGIADLTLEGNDIATAVIIGNEGTLSVTSFDNMTGIVTYNFAEDGNSESHNEDDDNVNDSFTIDVIDTEGDESAAELEIRILDTAPTAASDTGFVTEDQSPNVVTGDVTTNDTQGSDTAISVIAVGPGGGVQVGIPFASQFGTLDLNSDGTYTYTLDNGNAAVDNLNAGENLTEFFTYVIVDTDGDTSSASLTVTINGTTD